MPKLLIYNGQPVALIETFPDSFHANSRYGPTAGYAEGEIMEALSPDEGLANIIDVPEEVVAQLRAGTSVDLSPFLPEEEEEDEEDEDSI